MIDAFVKSQIWEIRA